MRRGTGLIPGALIWVSLWAGLFAVACGSSESPEHKATKTCTFRNPPQAGETIRHKLCLEGKLGAIKPKANHNRQGVDVSVWQCGLHTLHGFGLAFAMIQTNYGDGVTNSCFAHEVYLARADHIPWGVYTFLTGAPGWAQARLALRKSATWGRTLGVWADAEMPEAYGQVCSYTREASRHAGIVGVYGSPGTYAGGHCSRWDWPAEWGSLPAYPLPGYPHGSSKLRQDCGTCFIDGVEIDRDEALGILALAH